jgi:hypothetical protein
MSKIEKFASYFAGGISEKKPLLGADADPLLFLFFFSTLTKSPGFDCEAQRWIPKRFALGLCANEERKTLAAQGRVLVALTRASGGQSIPHHAKPPFRRVAIAG